MTTEVRITGKYRLGKKIGSGAFGEIHLGIFLYFNIKAINIENGEEVAVKLVFLSVLFL